MKKIIVVMSLIILSGCSNPAKNLQTNIFSDLWDTYVTKKDTTIIKNFISSNEVKHSQQEFAKLNNEISDLRNFLVLGEEITTSDGETVFREGLMKISDKNNEKLINELKKSFDTLDGSGNQKSLKKEIKEMKKNINKICLQQKVSVNCNL